MLKSSFSKKKNYKKIMLNYFKKPNPNAQ
jgi:hypothetical protein